MQVQRFGPHAAAAAAAKPMHDPEHRGVEGTELIRIEEMLGLLRSNVYHDVNTVRCANSSN